MPSGLLLYIHFSYFFCLHNLYLGKTQTEKNYFMKTGIFLHYPPLPSPHREPIKALMHFSSRNVFWSCARAFSSPFHLHTAFQKHIWLSKTRSSQSPTIVILLLLEQRAIASLKFPAFKHESKVTQCSGNEWAFRRSLHHYKI